MRAFAKGLCAYRPWLRIFASLHCIISLLMAAVLWNPNIYIHQFKHMYLVWKGPDKLVGQTFDMICSISILCSCSLLPYLYLRAMQWFNVGRAGSKELPALQYDLQSALDAVSCLKQRLSGLSQSADKFRGLGKTCSLQASSSASTSTSNTSSTVSSHTGLVQDDTANQEASPPASTSTSSTVSKHPRRGATPLFNQPQPASAAPVVNSDQLSLSKDQLAYGPQGAALKSSNRSNELHQDVPQFPPIPLEMPSPCYKPTAPNLCKRSSCREQQLAFSPTCDPQNPEHEPQIMLSPQLSHRAEAAIEASTTIIADLSQHLTAFVRVRTGAYIQGREACSAALSL